MDRVKVGDHVRIKHLNANGLEPVGIVVHIDGAYHDVSVDHPEQDGVIYECYNQELENNTVFYGLSF